MEKDDSGLMAGLNSLIGEDGTVSPQLSQEEIDSILGKQDAIVSDATGIQQLIESGQIYHERLPVLEAIFERFARLTSNSLRHFSSENIEITTYQTSSKRFDEYLNHVTLPAMVNIFKVEELNGFGLITFPSQLIYSFIEVLLGGSHTKRLPYEGRGYTALESRLVEKIVGILLDDLSTAFNPISAVNFDFERMEINPRYASIVPPANPVTVSSFRVDMEDRDGVFEIVLPYSLLEPIRHKLRHLFLGERYGGEGDSLWHNHFNAMVQHSHLDVSVILNEFKGTLGDVMDWKHGTILPLEVEPSTLVSLRAGDVDIMDGRMGKQQNKVAIEVNEKTYDPNTYLRKPHEFF